MFSRHFMGYNNRATETTYNKVVANGLLILQCVHVQYYMIRVSSHFHFYIIESAVIFHACMYSTVTTVIYLSIHYRTPSSM